MYKYTGALEVTMAESRGNKFTRICNTIGSGTIEIIDSAKGWPGLATASLDGSEVNIALHVSTVSPMARKDSPSNELRFQNPVKNDIGVPVTNPNSSIPILLAEGEAGILIMVEGTSRLDIVKRFSIPFPPRVVDEAKKKGWSVFVNKNGDKIYAFHPALFDVALSIVTGNSDVIPISNVQSIVDAFGVNALDNPKSRERIKRSTNALVRHYAFSKNVKDAYNHRCAMCGIDMGVVVGAHIHPVSAPKSVDLVTNGLALCQNHHTVFDNHKIWINPSTKKIKFHSDIIEEANKHKVTQFFIDQTFSVLSIPKEIELSPLEEMFEKRYAFFNGKYDWI